MIEVNSLVVSPCDFLSLLIQHNQSPGSILSYPLRYFQTPLHGLGGLIGLVHSITLKFLNRLVLHAS